MVQLRKLMTVKGMGAAGHRAGFPRASRDVRRVISPDIWLLYLICVLLGQLVGAVLCEAARAADAYPSMSVKPFMMVVSSDITPVTINTGRVILRIPRNYLQTAVVSGADILFRIVATFPGFHGVDDADDPKFHFNPLPKSPELITAINLSNISSAHVAWDVPSVRSAHDSVNTDYGLIKVASPLPSMEYFVSPWKAGQRPIVIKCGGARIFDRDAGCGVEVDLVPGLVMRYEYDRSLLPRWQEIHAGMMHLMASFVEK